MSGFLITFEGIEGCGKSTQVRLLETRLRGEGYRIVATREPGDGSLGEGIRDILLRRSSSAIAAMTELFLLVADRTQHVREIIRPALDENCIVISDRFGDSSMAYQGYGRGIDLDFIELLNNRATDNLVPDITFVLDMDAVTSLNRSQSRLMQQNLFEKEGRFEEENILFHQKVRAGYLDLARKHTDRIVLMDGTLEIAVAAQRIWNEVHERISGHHVLSGETEI
ncbi:dTMP kinase [bacterium]|nr:dTMP kinase [candidate division CSSED10-310 bacterium]